MPPKSELTKLYGDLPAEEQEPYKEWEGLFQFCNIPPSEPVGSIIIPTGGWLERVYPAFSFFKKTSETQDQKPSLVITGENGSQYLLPDLSMNAPKIAGIVNFFGNLTREEKNRIVVEENASNTKEQTDNIYELLLQGKIKSPLTVFVSAYHLPRWYMTMAKTILDHEGSTLQTRLYGIPVFTDWDIATRDDPRTSLRDRIPSEIKKIHDYQTNREGRLSGDVATVDELIHYHEWLTEAAA